MIIRKVLSGPERGSYIDLKIDGGCMARVFYRLPGSPAAIASTAATIHPHMLEFCPVCSMWVRASFHEFAGYIFCFHKFLSFRDSFRDRYQESS